MMESSCAWRLRAMLAVTCLSWSDALTHGAPVRPGAAAAAHAPRGARASVRPTMGLEENMFGDMIRIRPDDRTYIMGVDIKQNKYKTLDRSWDVDDSLDELQRLCETAGLEVVGRDYQNMQHPNPSTFIGTGKVREMEAAVTELDVGTVVFDDELTPAQQRNVQKALGGDVMVIDRTMLILQIFNQRARTREAKLQVQAAQLTYMMPRLQTYMTTGAGMDSKGGASSGGGGRFLKGAGESQLEMDRRLFRAQLVAIEKEMEEVAEKRKLYRDKRKAKDDLPVVAIVGYTNSGKSTLLNRLCSSDEVYADDLLFATLDPTTRRVTLPGGKEVLISDTVGFIQKLPTKLVSAFRATLEELEDANLILHVVDAVSPLVLQHVNSVQGIVDDMNAAETAQILVLNKADRLAEVQQEAQAAQQAREVREAELEARLQQLQGDEGQPEAAASDAEAAAAAATAAAAAAADGADGSSSSSNNSRRSGTGVFGSGGGFVDYVESPEALLTANEAVSPVCAIPTSARTGAGVDELLEMIELALLQTTVLVECTLPYSAGEFLGKIHKVGTVLEEEYVESGTKIIAYLPPSLRNKLQAERLLKQGQSGYSPRLARMEMEREQRQRLEEEKQAGRPPPKAR